MRQTFDRKVPLIEQRMRVANMKQPGRKHNKRMNRGKLKDLAKTHAKNVAAHKTAKARKLKAEVSKYWTGERECHP